MRAIRSTHPLRLIRLVPAHNYCTDRLTPVCATHNTIIFHSSLDCFIAIKQYLFLETITLNEATR